MKAHKLRAPYLAAVVAVAVIASGYLGLFASWQWKISDSLQVGRGAREGIVIVAIDDGSIRAVGRWPWSRGVHATLIGELAGAGASAIGYDVNFPEPSSEAEDSALEQAIADAGNVVLPFEAKLDLRSSPPVATGLLEPLPRFSRSAKLGFSNVPPDPDGVLRRVPTAVTTEDGSSRPVFAAALLAAAGGEPKSPQDRIVVAFAGKPGTYPTVSAADVLSGAVPASTFEGKIVLVGATAPDLHDELLTPTAKSVRMSGVEVHANILDSLRVGGLTEEPPIGVAATVILFAFLGAYAADRLRRIAWTVAAVVGALVAYVVAAFFVFEAGLVLDILYPAAALALSAAAGSLVRLSREKREKGQLRTTLQRYLSKQVVEYLVKHPEKLVLGGEKREMTVLFSDLRGFTTLSEGLTPEELVTVLNDYLSEMTGIVFAEGGVLDKYIGDAVMAFWNAPLDEPDHAEKAVRAAIGMRDRLAEMNGSGAFPKGIKLRLGVGVNTGQMVVGNMGGKERFDYTVMGDSVNLGSRLESLNKEYGTEIIVSESTAAKLSRAIVLRELDLVAVKGKKEPVGIHEVVGLHERLEPGAIESAERFAEALRLYRTKDFAAAKKRFEAILAAAPEDTPSKVYVSRCDAFLASPPPAGWDGVWVMTKK